ncbi:unnamed protein product [Durusdinium trenchii]|uniref:Uncharacterized protein n=1 Tax=Durusdinium trenchii TaxID=1381693 RepID=A0ABP0PCQ1_9DINO
MGCKQSRESAENYANELPEAKKESSLLLPEDDYVPSICGLRGGDFAVAGGEGWLYIYNSEGQQTVKLKAHRKSLNRLMESKDLLFSGSSDGTVLSWKGLKEGCQEPVQKFEGHSLAVSGLDLLEVRGSSRRFTGHTTGVRRIEVQSPGRLDLVKYWFCMTIPSKIRSLTCRGLYSGRIGFVKRESLCFE